MSRPALPFLYASLLQLGENPGNSLGGLSESEVARAMPLSFLCDCGNHLRALAAEPEDQLRLLRRASSATTTRGRPVRALSFPFSSAALEPWAIRASGSDPCLRSR